MLLEKEHQPGERGGNQGDAEAKVNVMATSVKNSGFVVVRFIARNSGFQDQTHFYLEYSSDHAKA